jgi:hypothetical protein
MLADRDAMPDVDMLAAALEDALKELREAAGIRPASEKAERPAGERNGRTTTKART